MSCARSSTTSSSRSSPRHHRAADPPGPEAPGAGRLLAMTSAVAYDEAPTPSFLFDLDGTLIDSVYQHVIAWRYALSDLGIDLSVWRIHRRIGMSGGLFVSALLRETG